MTTTAHSSLKTREMARELAIVSIEANYKSSLGALNEARRAIYQEKRDEDELMSNLLRQNSDWSTDVVSYYTERNVYSEDVMRRCSLNLNQAVGYGIVLTRAPPICVVESPPFSGFVPFLGSVFRKRECDESRRNSGDEPISSSVKTYPLPTARRRGMRTRTSS
jgi:hypothetical protein